MTNKEAISILKSWNKEAIYTLMYFNKDLSNFDDKVDRIEAHSLAIKALEFRVPKKVIIKPWTPCKCPKCGAELSEHECDGYYRHNTFLEVCPNCYQFLDWGEGEE